MPKFTKNILQVGTYHSPDGEVTVTPDRLKHWAESFKRMKAANIGIPVGWDHDDDPANSIPVQFSTKRGKRRPANGTAGYLDDFTVSKDGQSATIALDIPRAEDAEKVRHNLAYVSPVIYEQWVDGKKTSHEDCITHVDLVQHPVDNSQSKFSESIACAFRMGLDTGKPNIYRLQTEDEEMPEPPEEPSSEDVVVEETNADFSDVMVLLERCCNIVLPKDTTPENLVERLKTALLTKDAMESEDTMDMSTDTSDLDAATPQLQAMSLEAKKWRLHADSQHRGAVAKRLSALLDSGRCTPAEHKSKEASLKAVRLSLNNEGEHEPGTLEAWIESREAVPAGTFWDPEVRTQRMALEAAPHPDVVSQTLTRDEAKKEAKRILSRQ